VSTRGLAVGSDNSLEDLTDALRRFAAERDWEQFHSPKNLAAALNVEASEILEHFLWLTDEQSTNLSPESKSSVALELADVLLYLVRLADKLGIDLLQSAKAKLSINAVKYPIAKSRGSAKKYTEL
jgi:NTP pyrophosphatase (non-canonical NTP hydrolase)